MKRFNKLPKTPQGIQAVKAAKKRRLKPKFNYHLDISQWGATKQIVNDLKHVAMAFDEPDKIVDYKPVNLNMLDIKTK